MTGLRADLAEAAALDADLRRLHGSGDARALSDLHVRAEAFVRAPGARRFHLTQAWVYALVDGDENRIEALECDLRTARGL